MPKNETGEFELVLGNRQLLSGFAVVAILFGVFFAMGYIVGRNSTPSGRAQGTDIASTQPLTPGLADPGRTQTPPPAQSTPQAEASQEAAANPPQTTSEAEPAPPPPAPPAKAKEPVKPVEKAAEKTPAVQTPESMRPGTYLQVMAVTKPDAEVIAKALLGKGFPTLITPSSREGIFRVLVGPYKDATSLGNAKTELENTGFHPIPQKVADRS